MLIEVNTGRWFDSREDRWRERQERPRDLTLEVFSMVLSHLMEEDPAELGYVDLSEDEPSGSGDEVGDPLQPPSEAE